ncbi:hypothetical protein AB1Y20_008939 [Prymnesium parvum]|uniref:Uncharacterized protein n=1 Tax=Prymnesium parvum TaxID=97485 RepID=A0AB34K3M5_PRYPA
MLLALSLAAALLPPAGRSAPHPRRTAPTMAVPRATPLRTRLAGLSLPRASDKALIDLERIASPASTSSPPSSTLIVFGTYAADFNAIEYAQKLRYYLPLLRAQGLSRALLIINGTPPQCAALSQALSLPPTLELLSDPSGEAGRRFGVCRGLLADEERLPAYAKLLGMLLGLGAGGTLPAVAAGYIGNPWGTAAWIEHALAQGQRAGRWPANVLEVDGQGRVLRNAFAELPLVGSWGRRPLELATLRLQNMVGISLAEWGALQPSDPRCLTQLGGCVLLSSSGEVLFEFVDHGICGTADFEEVLKALG